jgi:4-amino-4-deoxy-L-arabinose transferase-like glycosyltransferase
VTRHPIAVLFAVCFLAWAPGLLTFPPLDRDESRFAQATKQMLETGDYVDIRFGDGPRYKKPAGIHWMQAISTEIFNQSPKRDVIWTYRIPSFLGAFAALALAFWTVRAFAGVETAFYGALALGLTLLVSSEAKLSKTDAVLLASVLGCQGVMLRAYLSTRLPGREAPGLKMALLGWFAFAVGVLLKGPIILGVCLVTVVAISWWDHEWKWFKRLYPWQGIVLVLALCLPWGIAIGIESHGLFYQESLEDDFGRKLIGGEETHGAPPGYYLALVSFSFWPATLLLIPGIWYGIRHRVEPAVRYLLCWAVGNWLMFEAAPTKLPHYILPAYPALAFLGALWLTRPVTEESKGERIARRASAVLFALVAIFFALITGWAPDRFGSGSVWFLYAAGGLGALVALIAAAMIWQARNAKAVAVAALAVLILYPTFALGTAPRLEQLWLSPRLAEAVQRHALPNDPPVIASGYTEPSLVFLLGTHTKLLNGKPAGEEAAKTGGLALIGADQEPRFQAALRAGHAKAQPLETIDGINYSRGLKMHVTLYRVTPGAAP